VSSCRGFELEAEQTPPRPETAPTASTEDLGRPAFYALRSGGWRDYVTLLHPPYTAWHLSYVVFGAAAAPEPHTDRLLATLAAFFLAVGVCAHFLDELRGRPLGTSSSERVLFVVAISSLAGAVAIGVAGLFIVSWSLLPFIVAGAFMVVAYNLELFEGRFHTDFWFAAAWGAFPALTSYWANALELRVEGLLVAGACFGFSVAQRRLSSPVRELRRRTVELHGQQRLADGRVLELSIPRLVAPLDGALRALSGAMVLLALGLIAVRF
jgi:hypothetical protein